MQITRYWNDDKETVSHESGMIDTNGDFRYAGGFGLSTVFKNYHYATEREAALDLIKQIDGDIKVFEDQKARIVDKYLGGLTMVTNEQRAIEFASYMAKSAEEFLNALEIAYATEEDNEDVSDKLTDQWKCLQSSIHEFRKRAKKCAPNAKNKPESLQSTY